MYSHSSTSNSDRRPQRKPGTRWVALVVAVGLIILGETAIRLSNEHLLDFEECILQWKIAVLDDPEREYDVLVLGASRVVHGVVPHELERSWNGEVDCVNLAINGCPVDTIFIMLDRYLQRHPPPRAVIASVVPLFLGRKKPPASGFEVRSLYRFRDLLDLGGVAGIDPYLDWLEGRIPSRSRRGYVRRAVQLWDSRFSTEGDYDGLVYRQPDRLWRRLSDEDGYTPFVDATLEGKAKHRSAYFSASFEVLPVHSAYLDRLITLCSSRGIRLYLFATPVPLTLSNHNAARGYNRQIRLFWEKRLAQHPDVHWVGPFHRAGADELFVDWWCHPTEEGALHFTSQLAGFIRDYAESRGHDWL